MTRDKALLIQNIMKFHINENDEKYNSRLISILKLNFVEDEKLLTNEISDLIKYTDIRAEHLEINLNGSKHISIALVYDNKAFEILVI